MLHERRQNAIQRPVAGTAASRRAYWKEYVVGVFYVLGREESLGRIPIKSVRCPTCPKSCQIPIETGVLQCNITLALNLAADPECNCTRASPGIAHLAPHPSRHSGAAQPTGA